MRKKIPDMVVFLQPQRVPEIFIEKDLKPHMDSVRTLTEVVDVAPWSHQVYHNAEDFWKKSRGLHHAYLIYRTLNGDYKHIFQPDSVFYVGKSPAAYFKKVNSNTISDSDIRRWQKFLWNQAVVPMLIVKSRHKIHIYTSNTTPVQENSQQRIIDILEGLGDVSETLELEQIWNLIESGMLYKQKPEAFYRYNSVDQYLLRNLNSTALKLAQTQKGAEEDNLKFAHYFLTRLLFVCYLIERGMVQGKHFDDEHLKKIQPANEKQKGYFLRHLFDHVSDNKKRCDLLCKLFEYIKDHFNGSLFPKKISEEKKYYTNEFINILNSFIQGQDIGTSQMVLGFWAYDFSVIPIETISSIWESFLGEQGKLKTLQENIDSRREAGAYYTPLHLAELTVDIALEDIEDKTGKKIHELKVLDPACGSGVFLVSLFGRIAESYYRNIKKTTGIEWARKLKQKLNQLYGLDISSTSCHITCFSLYLAYLEWLNPNDIEYLLKYNEKLPPLLEGTREDSWNTIYEDNLFNPNLSFKEKDFDIIIGNPPWVGSPNQKDKYFLKWSSKQQQILGPNKQIAHGFMWMVPEFISTAGAACLLLPAAVLFNEHTNKFQKEWLSHFAINRVVNFSDLRRVLFENAIRPCVAILFNKKNYSEESNEILYESPKTDILSQRGGSIYIREEDTKRIHSKEIIHAAKNNNAPLVWKEHYWGSWRDSRLLSRLVSLPKLYTLTGKSHRPGIRWDKGTGIMDGSGSKKKGFWDFNDLFLNSRQEFSLVISKQDCTTISESNLPLEVEAPRREELFFGPKVLITEGSQNIKVGFCGFKVFFKKSIYSIVGPQKDIDYLRFLSAVINSDLIKYYLFHTSSDWGIERDRIHFQELLSIPFFLPENHKFHEKANEIVTNISKEIKDFENFIEDTNWFGQEIKREEKTNKLYKKFEPLIRKYYNIDPYESMLIDNTLELAVKSFHPVENQENIPTLKEPDKTDCEIYAKTLCEMLNNFGKGSNFKVKGEVLKGLPYSVVCITLTNKVIKNISVSDSNEKLSTAIRKIKPLLEEKRDRFVFCQNLKVFDGDNLYLLKPMQMRFWSRTAALNDADEIAGAILNSRSPK